MNKNNEKANTIIKLKKSVWKVKIGVGTDLLANNYDIEPRTKLWEIKVIMN